MTDAAEQEAVHAPAERFRRRMRRRIGTAFVVALAYVIVDYALGSGTSTIRGVFRALAVITALFTAILWRHIDEATDEYREKLMKDFRRAQKD